MNQPVAKKASLLKVNPWLSAWGLALLFAGCSGSSSSGEAIGSSNGPFVLSSVSVTSGAVWQVNRPVKFTFSTPVDFDTVNLNTISIQRINGQPAVGEFTMDPVDPRSVVFQPVCPTKEDFSDAGFRPGGIVYQIDVPSVSSGATTVRSTTGKGVSTGFTLSFSTPTSTILSQIFLDPLPGPARPVTLPGVGTMVTTGTGADGGTVTETFFSVQPDGSGGLPSGFLVSNNFYSDPASQVAMNIRFDQPVSPLAANISSSRILLQYFSPNSTWKDLVTELTLTANCSGTGASLRVTPVGILPQGRLMRLVVTPEFEDLVGDRNTTPIDKFAIMTADAAVDGGGSPVDTADELLEEFLDSTFEDVGAALSAPSADWGPDGLKAAFAFDGTGGPGGQFDLHVPPNTELIFNTTSQVFTGGPDGQPQFTQLAVNGRLDVRNLKIPATSRLRIQGPNPATILASGFVQVDGLLICDGGSATPVFTLDTPQQPESGAAGQAGGGDGGIGSFLTTVVTQRGGNGEGPFGVANLGGEGGESGWSTNSGSNGIFRRAGGGGGGRLGHDQQVLFQTGGNDFMCDDQTIYGLDAESGFTGDNAATSSQGPHLPYGGHAGVGPFGVIPGVQDDFQGTKIQNFATATPLLIKGELTGTVGGAGGGAGGDATFLPATESYPPQTLVSIYQDKGAGGGGGAGSLTILALGDIIVAGSGKITAIGGHGNGGENTSGSNRIGGGSGGGSGGHLVLQSAGRINLSGVPAGFKAIDARGGEGGAGTNNTGGASNGELALVWNDAKHPGVGVTTETDNPWEIIPAECKTYTDGLNAATEKYIVRCAGGDGGPGLIQLHVGNLATDILYPTNVASLSTVTQPVPHGYDIISKTWTDHLLPIFGRFSMSQSRWISLGQVSIDPVSAVEDEISFLFQGTNPGTGFVVAGGDEIVDALAPILTEPIQLDPNDPTFHTAILNPALLSVPNQIYIQNPNLLRNFTLTAGGIPYNVESAVLDPGDSKFHVTVSDNASSLQLAAGNVELRPRYFGITTSGIENFLPASSSVKIEFDLAEADAANVSLPSSVNTTGFVSNLAGADLNSLGVDPTKVRFMRYRVSFDITQGITALNADTPRPIMDFLRMPYRF